MYYITIDDNRVYENMNKAHAENAFKRYRWQTAHPGHLYWKKTARLWHKDGEKDPILVKGPETLDAV